MKILYETDELILEHISETFWLKSKSTGDILLEDECHGDPECGLIGTNNQWALIAGEHLTIWTPQQTKVIKQEGLRWIHSIRLKTQDIVEILVDPWNDIASIWEINVKSFELEKIRDFDDYKDSEYSDLVIW